MPRERVACVPPRRVARPRGRLSPRAVGLPSLQEQRPPCPGLSAVQKFRPGSTRGRASWVRREEANRVPEMAAPVWSQRGSTPVQSPPGVQVPGRSGSRPVPRGEPRSDTATEPARSPGGVSGRSGRGPGREWGETARAAGPTVSWPSDPARSSWGPEAVSAGCCSRGCGGASTTAGGGGWRRQGFGRRLRQVAEPWVPRLGWRWSASVVRPVAGTGAGGSRSRDRRLRVVAEQRGESIPEVPGGGRRHRSLLAGLLARRSCRRSKGPIPSSSSREREGEVRV